jgi:hypothetical protein
LFEKMMLRSLAHFICLCAVLLVATAHGQKLVEAGFPALDREWNGKDYETVASLLKDGKVPLPTLATPEGQRFLQRLTSPENLSFARNKDLPIGARLGDFARLMVNANLILMRYVVVANQNVNVHAETTMQMCFALRIAETGVNLVEEFLPSLPKDDKYETRMAGLRKTYSGMTTLFGGAETSLGEATFYSPDDLSSLLQSMAEVLPTVKKAFPPEYRVELRKKLEGRKTAFPKEKDAANLQKMIGEIGS